MRYTLCLLASLAGLWLLLSGHYTPLLLGLGAVSCLLVTLLARRMWLVDEETHPLQLAQRLPGYWLWLAREIAGSNLDVAGRILRPGLPISPTMIRLSTHEKTELGQVIYANSITLTPGTVSVELRGGEIGVHALTRAGAGDLREGEMDRRVQVLEGGSHGGPS